LQRERAQDQATTDDGEIEDDIFAIDNTLGKALNMVDQARVPDDLSENAA